MEANIFCIYKKYFAWNSDTRSDYFLNVRKILGYQTVVGIAMHVSVPRSNYHCNKIYMCCYFLLLIIIWASPWNFNTSIIFTENGIFDVIGELICFPLFKGSYNLNLMWQCCHWNYEIKGIHFVPVLRNNNQNTEPKLSYVIIKTGGTI